MRLFPLNLYHTLAERGLWRKTHAGAETDLPREVVRPHPAAPSRQTLLVHRNGFEGSASGLGLFRVSGMGLRIRVQGLGPGFGFRVSGLGLRMAWSQ